MIAGLFDPRARFWRWFEKNEPRLFAFDPVKEDERERLFDDLSKHLAKIHPDLTFEFGPQQPKREFVVSAAGIKKAFPEVTKLVAAAPRLERWDVIAFRPRRPLCDIEIGGARMIAKNVQFSLLDNGEIAGIYLFIPGYADGNIAYKQIGYLLLDGVLGEFNVETKLGLIKMYPLEAETDLDRYPLAELPRLFDGLVERLGQADPRA
jgi:hypothetical protein